MPTIARTDRRAPLAVMFLMTVVVGIAATLPMHWHRAVRRAWSFGVYYIGYRLVKAQLRYSELAVSGVPFVLKHA